MLHSQMLSFKIVSCEKKMNNLSKHNGYWNKTQIFNYTYPPPILCLLLWLMLCPMHDSLPYQNTFYNYRLKNRATKCTNGDESKKKKTLDSLYFCFNYTLLHCLNTHVEGKKTRIMEEKVFLPCVPIVFASQCKKTKNNR